MGGEESKREGERERVELARGRSGGNEPSKDLPSSRNEMSTRISVDSILREGTDSFKLTFMSTTAVREEGGVGERRSARKFKIARPRLVSEIN